MNQIDLEEESPTLSECLARLEEGQILVVHEGGTPIAEIRVLPRAQTGKRSVGLAKGLFEVPADFFDPLPEEMLSAFEGKRP